MNAPLTPSVLGSVHLIFHVIVHTGFSAACGGNAWPFFVDLFIINKWIKSVVCFKRTMLHHERCNLFYVSSALTSYCETGHSCSLVCLQLLLNCCHEKMCNF